MATTGSPSGRGVASPRPKGRDAKHTLCRNVVIYGHCRYENSGCNFQHDRAKINPPGAQNDKKRFNADSPAFQPTPLQPTTNLPPPTNGLTAANRNATISPKAANAAIFTPKTQNSQPATSSMGVKDASHAAQEFYPQQEYQDFVSGTFESPYTADANSLPYEAFSQGALTTLAGQTNQMSLTNMYPHEAQQVAGASYYTTGSFSAPLNNHLYFPIGPHHRKLPAYQKLAHEFFIPNAMRESLQKKCDASRQVLHSANLPARVGVYHTLLALDTSNKKSNSCFGYTSWVYKVVRDDGLTYALRRLEGYHASEAAAITSAQKAWAKINNPSVVTIHEAFTTQSFHDSSLIVVTDYHPLSKTLEEKHFAFGAPRAVPENVLWGYIVQITSALKEIHENGLAAKVITLNKVIETSTNRIRLNGCGVTDITMFDVDRDRTLAEFQRQDIAQLGILILAIGSGNPLNALTVQPAQIQSSLAQFSQRHNNLGEFVKYLIHDTTVNIGTLLGYLAPQITTMFSSSLHAEDELTSNLARELENGRLVRLMAKLGAINERPEYEGSESWSETGSRYPLKLFRDYVFHQVDAQGRPQLDLAHIITCLNKLDAAVDEKVMLTSRNEQDILVATYKELARMADSAWSELLPKTVGRSYR